MRPPLPTPSPTEPAYGCVFCLSGKEMLVAQHLESHAPGLRALAVRQTKRRTTRGVTRLVDEVIFRGYVFFRTQGELPPPGALPPDCAIALLTDSDGDWRLHGQDAHFAHWLFSIDGLIGLSRAHQEGDRIRVVQGPLKALEGSIVRVDRRNRSGQVALSFGGRQIRVWLGFDIVEKLTADGAKHAFPTP